MNMRWRGVMRLVASISWVFLWFCGLPLRANGLCADVITTLVPQRVFRIPTAQLRRVEIRSCLPGAAENLQFVGWETRKAFPSLVLAVPDEAIVQLYMSGDVFVFETTGGAHTTVIAIVYEKGAKPRLAVREVIKDAVEITASEGKVRLSYSSLSGSKRDFTFDTGTE